MFKMLVFLDFMIRESTVGVLSRVAGEKSIRKRKSAYGRAEDSVRTFGDLNTDGEDADD